MGSAAKMTELPTLRGDGFELRHLRASDLPALKSIFGHPDVARFMGIPQMKSLEDARELLDHIRTSAADGDLFQWGLALPDGHVAGTCTLAHIDRENERAEIGFALHPDHWGRGLMTRVVPLVIDHAFDQMGLHRIEADVDPRNVPSLHLLERLGFVREGYLRERHIVGGERQDTVFFGLLKTEWNG